MAGVREVAVAGRGPERLEWAGRLGADLVIDTAAGDPAGEVARLNDGFGPDLVIEFQVEREVAPMIGDKIAGAGIPLIAIDIPHPHATYFGVDNYRVGIEAGEALAAHATTNWEGKVDWVIGLDLPEAGQLVQSRITGAFEGVRAGHPELPVETFVRIDGRADSFQQVLGFRAPPGPAGRGAW